MRQWMFVPLAFVAMLFVSSAQAQEPKKKWEEDHLTVTPRAVEEPLGKYRLFPAEHELVDGNAAPILLRNAWDEMPYFRDVVPMLMDYLVIPLDDPQIQETRDVLPARFYERLKRAAYQRNADWEYPIGEKPFPYIMLPDVQDGKSIVGRALSVWIRSRIANGEVNNAMEGILVGFAVARHYGRTPFVIVQLVCAGLDTLMFERVEELLEMNDCPNLYWALTMLPRPLVEIRPSIEMEARFLELTIDGMKNPDLLQSDEEWEAAFNALIQVFQDTGGLKDPEQTAATLRVRLPQHGRAELPSLIEGGAERVDEMSDAEAGLRWFASVHRGHAEEMAALVSLEPPAAIPALRELETRMDLFRQKIGMPTPFLSENVLRNYLATRRLDLRIDALRVIEAIRHYGATHEGELPASLDQITDLPVPNNPLTGEPFHYEVTNGIVHLWTDGIIDRGHILWAGIDYRIEFRK